MGAFQANRVGKRGAVILPASLRKRFGIEEGSLVVAEERDGGIFIRPAMLVPLETYSPDRKAEFLLTNAVDTDDYSQARKTVANKLRVDPGKIKHRRPRP